MKIFKVSLIVLLSVIGAAGIILLGIYLSGGFDQKLTYPNDVFFANVTTVDGVDSFSERGSTPYNKTENFKLIISTSTAEFNQGDVALSFPTNQTGSVVRYLKKVGLDETFVGNVFLYYAHDSNGKVIKFASCGESQAEYITNGTIIVPVKVNLNKYFDALVCIAPENINEELKITINQSGEIAVNTKLYNVGGYAQLIARSSNLKVASTSAYINIDVPVEKIEIVGITGENFSPTNVLGLNEKLLTLTDANSDGVLETEVGIDGLFSVVLDVAPARAVYKYGRNGSVGAAQYKTVVFSLNTDEGLIAFADSNGNELSDIKTVSGAKYIYSKGVSVTDLFGADFDLDDYTVSWDYSNYLNIINAVEIENKTIFVNIKNNLLGEYFEINITATPKNVGDILTSKIYGNDNSLTNGTGVFTTTAGTKFIAKGMTGQSQVHVGIFKNSILEDEAIASVGTNLTNLLTLMNSELYGITKTSLFNIKEIAIEGFEITDKYNQGAGSELELKINRPTIIYANNPDSDYSLGIDIHSNISAQNRIKNILLSVQYSRDNGTTWFDATQVQNVEINSQLVSIPALLNFYSGNQILTQSALGISEENPIYSFNFYRPISSSNMSYWEIVGTSASENTANYGITSIKIFVYYLNPESNLVLEDSNYGPYPVDTVVKEAVETDVEWNVVEDSKTNEYLGAGNYNERFLIGAEERISLENLFKITNPTSNPTYTTIRYFVYSNIENLETMLNVEKYYGAIDGVSGEIYEVNPQSNYLICRNLGDRNEIEFKLIFAVVEHLPNGNPVIYNDGENNFYRVINLPKDSDDYTIYAPFKINKVLNTINVEVDTTPTSEELNGTIEPYENDLNIYFLQNTKDNLRVSITVDDADLFIQLAKNQKVVLNATYLSSNVSCNDIYLSYEDENQEKTVEISNVLATIFESQQSIDKFVGNGVLKISPDGLTYTISLSTKQINFEEDDEKAVRVDLTYTLEGSNIPETYTNPRIETATNFYIYSGKIKDIYFGTEGLEVVAGYDGKIYIDKTVVAGQFSTSIYSYLLETDYLNNNKNYITSFFDENFYANVYLKNSFGIDDSYTITITSSEPSIAQVVYNIQDKKYSINFLSKGEATIYLTPNYAHSEFETIELSFVISSNYKLEDKYYTDVAPPDTRIISYSSLNYQIVGQANAEIIDFNKLIKILATIEGESPADVTSKFRFYLSNIETSKCLVGNPTLAPTSVDGITTYTEVGGNYVFSDILQYNTTNQIYTFLKAGTFTIIVDNHEYIVEVAAELTAEWYSYENHLIYNDIYTDGKIELQNGANGLTGFAIKNNFGAGVVLVISAVSTELGSTFIFNITMVPFEQISANIPNHTEAPKPSAAEAGSNAVFAESDINIENFQYENYDVPDKNYKSTIIPELNYSIYKNGILVSTISAVDGEVLVNDSNFLLIAKLTFSGSALTKIVFTPVSELTKYSIVITRLDSSGNIYDLKKEFTFYVSPNIKVDETSFENGETVDLNGVISLNNELNPILNGDDIKVIVQGNIITLTFGTQSIKFTRIYVEGTSVFDSDKLQINGQSDLSLRVSGIKKLGEQELIISYSGKQIKVKYYAAPNIKVSDSAKVIYNGEEYIALYATQDISNLNSWFNYGDQINPNLSIKYGDIVSVKNILSLPRLYDLASKNSVNLVEDGSIYYITKNGDGLITTSIVVSYGTGTNREYRVFKVLIFPIEWEYIKYSEITDISTVDIKEIFNGEYSETVLSGKTAIISEDFIPNSKFDLYVKNNFIKYNVYLITQSGETEIVNNNQNSIYIDFINDKLSLITQSIGENRQYRIKFTYTATASGYPNAKYEFSYYVNLKKTQSIQVNYPYGASGDEGEIEEFVNYQNIYYSQFSNGTYVLDLNSATRNVSGKFVQLSVGETKIDQSSSTLENHNKLNFEIYKVYNYDVNPVTEITSNISNYITVNSNGIITLKDVGVKIAYIIKVSTPNGAVNYYKIITEANPGASVKTVGGNVDIYDEGSTTPTNNISSGTTLSSKDIIIINDASVVEGISKSFDLSQLTASGVQGGYKFALINCDTKKVLNNTDMMYIHEEIITIEEIATTKYYVVSKISANEQKAILLVYTEKDGIIAEIEVLAESSYKVEFTQLPTYGDSTINIANYLTITMNGTNLDPEQKAGLTYELTFNDSGYTTYITNISGSSFSTNLINTARIFNITVKVYGGVLNLEGGDTDEQKCVSTFDLVVSPSIVASNKTGTTNANQNTTGHIFNTSTMFSKNSSNTIDYTDYKYDVLVSTFTGGNNEFVSLESGSSYTNFVLTDLLKSMSSLSNNITLYISSVSTTRTATITVKIYKGESASKPTGDVITATYTLTIYPDTLIDVKYPDYDTGITYTSEYVYWKDYFGTNNIIDLTDRMSYYKLSTPPTTAPTSVNGKINDSNIMTFGSGGYNYLVAGTYIVVVDGDEYKVVVVSDGATVPTYSATWYKKETPAPANVTYTSSNESLVSVNESGEIRILNDVALNEDVSISIYIDGIFRHEYKLTITNDVVFTAQFSDKTATKTQEIADTKINADTNLFAIDYGKLSVQTKSGTVDKMFKVTVSAVPNPKYTGRVILPVDSVDLYGVGSGDLGNATLYKVGSNQVTPNPSFTNLTSSCDILGVENDSDIWTLPTGTSGNIEYKQAGTYMVKIVTETNTNYYLVVVVESGTEENLTYTPTYYGSTGETELTFNDIFGDNISNYDMYIFDYSTTNSSVVNNVATVQPSALMTYYYNGYQIPYNKAKEKFGLNCYTNENLTDNKWISLDDKLIQNFKLEYVSYTNEQIDYETRIIKIYSPLGAEVATYKYTVVYDFNLPLENFDEVDVSENEASGKNGTSYYYIKSAPNINIAGTTIASIDYQNKPGLTYDNGKFITTRADTFEIIVKYSNNTVKNYTIVTAHEFNSYTYGKKYLVLKPNLIELDAISLNSPIMGYDLIDLLIQKLGLTALDGLPFNKTAFKSTADLYYTITDGSITYGSYTSNSRYVNNISGILGTSVIQPETGETLGSYNIIPYGAQNGGDIVHLTLKFGDKFYVLRIKINPTITLVSKNSVGDFSTIYEDNDPTDYQMKYSLSNFVTLNGADPSKIEMLVLDDSDSQYVVGGNIGNKLVSYGTGTSLNDYGIKLYETKLGGAKIRFKISDPYGYVATDSAGGSALSAFTLYYRNATDTTPAIYTSSTTSFYEGSNLNIVYTYLDGEIRKYKVYNFNNFNNLNWEDVTDISSITNPIIISNIDATTIATLTPSLTGKADSVNGLLTVENSAVELTTTLLPNTRYNSEGKITGTTFQLLLSYVNNQTGITETARINLNIEVKQKYKVQFKEPYGNFADIYFRNGVDYSISDLIEIIDNETGFKETNYPSLITLGNSTAKTSFDDLEYTNTSSLLSIISTNLKVDNNLTYVDKIADGGVQYVDFTYESKKFLIPISFKVTPYYYNLDAKYVSTYSTYGRVVSWNSSEGLVFKLSDWGNKYLLEDYYGYILNRVNNAPTVNFYTVLSGNPNSVSKSSESTLIFSEVGEYIVCVDNWAVYKVIVKEGDPIYHYYQYATLLKDSLGTSSETLIYERISGSSVNEITGEITNMTAGESVILDVKSNGVKIGSVKVTMNKYYRLAGGENKIYVETNGTLPFETSKGTGWGEGIYALVAGSDINEQISDGGLFSYSASVGNIEYSPTLGSPVANNYGDATTIDITVSHMGREIGTITLTKTSEGWSTTSLGAVVRFNANGGEGNMADQLFPENDLTNNLTQNAFTREDYTFSGWATTADAIVPEFLDEENYTIGSQNVMLYAIWEKNS